MAKVFRSDDYVFVGKHFDIEQKRLLDRNSLLRILGTVDTTSVNYELKPRSGFPELPDYDGKNLSFVNPKRGFNKVISPREKLGAYEMGEKDYRNDRSGELQRAGKDLAKAAENTIANDCLRLFGGAWVYTGGDGKTWAASDHPNAAKYDEGRTYIADASSGTSSNLIQSTAGTYLEFATAGIDRAQVIGSKFMTPEGNPYKGNYDLLLVSPDLAPQARKLLGDDKNIKLMPTKDPESAENAASSIYGLKWLVVGAGDGVGALGLKGKQWALCDSETLKETALIVYGKRPEVREGKPDNPYVKTFVAYADYGLGFADWRCILFSNPA